MSIDPSTFETTVPSRYITCTIPLHRRLIRVAILDSPSAAAAAPSSTAAMWVTPGRESDWIFSTFTGHLQLLLSSPAAHPLSRLILVGNPLPCPNPTSYDSTSPPPPFPLNIAPLLLGLTPKSEFVGGSEIPEVPLLVYEDDVVRSSILEVCEGPFVGEMLIENVELVNDGVREFRRRLRFKRIPNFVQSQMRIRPRNGMSSKNLDDMDFELDKGVLVQQYLSPMIAGIAVIHRYLDERRRNGFRPKALCLGVGGGALLGYLSKQLNFEVDGVEEDEAVLAVAKKYFGLDSDEFIHLFAEDGIRYIKKIAYHSSGRDDNKFDVVMVDMDSSDVMDGACAPPIEFVERSVLRATGAVLRDEGILIANVIPSSRSFYERLICEFHEVFEELYEIVVENEENLVVIATKSASRDVLDEDGSAFLDKLKVVVPRSYTDSIRKISKIQ